MMHDITPYDILIMGIGVVIINMITIVLFMFLMDRIEEREQC